MGWYIMFDVNNPKICCQEKCNHSDCKETKRMAATPCRFCDRSIQPGEKYYLERQGKEVNPVHFLCYVEHMEAKNKPTKEQ